MKVISAAGTDIGMVREANQDSYLVEEPLFVVADGMGGHFGGEIASQTAVASLEGKSGEFANDPTPSRTLVEMIRAANLAIVQRATEDPELYRMGTTLTAAVTRDSHAYVAHVGDSRAYLLRGGELRRLTEDHTLVGELEREGKLTPEQARHHPQRSIITRALGVDMDVEVDTATVMLAPGDRLMLCSDGLYGMIDDDEIREIMVREKESQAACDALIKAANDAGGDDNVTVVIFDVIETRRPNGMPATAGAGASGGPGPGGAGDTSPEAQGAPHEPGVMSKRRRRWFWPFKTLAIGVLGAIAPIACL